MGRRSTNQRYRGGRGDPGDGPAPQLGLRGRFALGEDAIDIDDYRRKAPRGIPGAQIAWTRPYRGTDLIAVAYSKQWNNPRPDVAVKSIDMVYGPNRRGVPVLIAVTAASAR